MRKRVAGLIRRVRPAATMAGAGLELSAVGLVAYGFHEAWAPLGYIVGGVLGWLIVTGAGRR